MTDAAIDITNLRVRGGGREILALDRLWINVGEACTLLGPNGAGKSTLLKCCLGLIGLSGGDVVVLGQSVARLRGAAMSRLRCRVGYVPQVLATQSEMPLTVREVVATGRTGIAGLFRRLDRNDWRTVDHWIDRLGLAALSRQSYGQLSGGEQRKTLIATAMVQQPEVLLLDEPTANLDLFWREQIVATLAALYAETRVTILLVCHELEVIPACSRRLVLLESGRLAADGPPEAVLTSERVASLYGGGLRVVHEAGRHAVIPAGEAGAMIDLALWGPVLCAGVLAGASTGALGVFIVGMRIPFLGVCVAHAALAGAVFGSLAGLAGPTLILPAMAGATLTALLLGLVDPERLRVDSNVILGLLFSFTMGLAFLGLGLFDLYGRSKNDVLDLLWGSVLMCRWRDCAIMAASAVAQIAFIGLFWKEMRAILFSRSRAAAAGVRVPLVWTLFLILASLVITVNFQTVGGLMIYSLLTNPAAAAFLLVKGYGRAIALSAVLGAASGLGGFLICRATDLPAGAMIVILSSLIVALAAVVAHLRRMV